MNLQESIMIEDLDEYSVPMVIVLLCATPHPTTKTKLMHHCIDRYGKFVEHGPYLYGEYSDDIDEAMEALNSWGCLDSKWRLTDFGDGVLKRIYAEIDDEEINAVLGEYA